MTFTDIRNKISEILSRKGKGSITPNDTFGLLKEITDKVEAVDYNQGRLAVKRSYASIVAMNADTAPTNQENGKKLQYGELVIIANAANASDADNGKIYRWLGTGNGWEFVLKVGSARADGVLVDDNQLSFDAVTVEDALNIINISAFDFTNPLNIVSYIEGNFLKEDGTLSGYFNPAYSVLIYSLQDCELIKISGKIRGTAVAVFAYYSDQNITELIKVGNINISGENSYNITCKIPSFAKYIAVTHIADCSLIAYKGVHIRNVQHRILETINNQLLSYNSIIHPTAIIKSKYINSTGQLTFNDNYSVNIYNISALDVISIKGESGGVITPFAFYTDLNCTVLASPIFPHLENTPINVDAIVTIPINANYVALTIYPNKSLNIYGISAPISQRVDSAERAISSLNTAVGLYTHILDVANVYEGNYIKLDGTLSGQFSSMYSVKIYNVSAYNILKIKGTTSGTIAPYVFYADESCTNIISKTLHDNPGLFDVNDVVSVPNGANYIGITCYGLLQLGVYPLSNHVISEEVINSSLKKLDITAVGDSLTAGAGGDGTTYLSALINLINGASGFNAGVGGEGVNEIMGRQGGAPFYIARNLELPSSTNPILLSSTDILSTYDNGYCNLLLQGGDDDINPLIIDNVECNLTRNGGNLYLARTKSGPTVVLNEGSVIFTNMMKTRRNTTSIFYMGTNGGYNTPLELIDRYNKMINFNGTDNYIIIGIHYKVGYTLNDFIELEKLMTKTFGYKYINYRKYLTTHALFDAGITPTTSDMSTITQGFCPPSLLADGVHFNATGYTLLGHYIYKRGQQLGYWM